MPRKQRFKPSRKPKQTNEEVGKGTVDQQTHGDAGDRLGGARPRDEVHPDDVEIEEMRGSPSARSP